MDTPTTSHQCALPPAQQACAETTAQRAVWATSSAYRGRAHLGLSGQQYALCRMPIDTLHEDCPNECTVCPECAIEGALLAFPLTVTTQPLVEAHQQLVQAEALIKSAKLIAGPLDPDDSSQPRATDLDLATHEITSHITKIEERISEQHSQITSSRPLPDATPDAEIESHEPMKLRGA